MTVLIDYCWVQDSVAAGKHATQHVTRTGGATPGPAGAPAPPSFQKCSESTVHNADYLSN
jgi:hypothetical protein